MAEALGVVASGIAVVQVAGQLGGAVIKLKKLWDEIQGGPRALKDLIDHLEHWDIALATAEAQQQQLPIFAPLLATNALVALSLQASQRAKQAVSEVADALSEDIQSTRRRTLKRAMAKVRAGPSPASIWARRSLPRARLECLSRAADMRWRQG